MNKKNVIEKIAQVKRVVQPQFSKVTPTNMDKIDYSTRDDFLIKNLDDSLTNTGSIYKGNIESELDAFKRNQSDFNFRRLLRAKSKLEFKNKATDKDGKILDSFDQAYKDNIGLYATLPNSNPSKDSSGQFEFNVIKGTKTPHFEHLYHTKSTPNMYWSPANMKAFNKTKVLDQLKGNDDLIKRFNTEFEANPTTAYNNAAWGLSDKEFKKVNKGNRTRDDYLQNFYAKTSYINDEYKNIPDEVNPIIELNWPKNQYVAPKKTKPVNTTKPVITNKPIRPIPANSDNTTINPTETTDLDGGPKYVPKPQKPVAALESIDKYKKPVWSPPSSGSDFGNKVTYDMNNMNMQPNNAVRRYRPTNSTVISNLAKGINLKPKTNTSSRTYAADK